MTTTLIDLLRKTLAAIEHNDHVLHDAPAMIELRRNLVRAIGDLEAQKDPPSSDLSRKSRWSGEA